MGWSVPGVFKKEQGASVTAMEGRREGREELHLESLVGRWFRIF